MTTVSSLSQPRPDETSQLFGHFFVRDALPFGELSFGKGDVTEDFELLDQGLVVRSAEEHRGAPTPLRKNEGSAGLANLLDERGDVGSKRREGLDVGGGFDGGHEWLPRRT